MNDKPNILNDNHINLASKIFILRRTKKEIYSKQTCTTIKKLKRTVKKNKLNIIKTVKKNKKKLKKQEIKFTQQRNNTIIDTIDSEDAIVTICVSQKVNGRHNNIKKQINNEDNDDIDTTNVTSFNTTLNTTDTTNNSFTPELKNSSNKILLLPEKKEEIKLLDFLPNEKHFYNMLLSNSKKYMHELLKNNNNSYDKHKKKK